MANHSANEVVKSKQAKTASVKTLQQNEPEKYAHLRAEAAAPYRGLRRFFYASCAASGAIGGFIFVIQLLAGRGMENTGLNLAVQVGVVALMIWFWRLENRAEQKEASNREK
ncbi:DUF3493 domain-containing protein [Phormidium sp. CLA17]|uniref:DUF3493 domain-containing protein n=1 Tax=Leptolyngbya sp. Cla-17 TaxID=2803751 RepID=UPI001492F66B|nr:DUF3493 domain-containing protein [Leptolyngbya sp. Cla-17]MBM0741625.1 DUF3493 domain-containing protein [Leptolyngbya sp. Cla-17]